MKNIVIQSEDNYTSQILVEELELNLPFRFIVSQTNNTTFNLINNNKVNVIVFNYDEVNLSLCKFIKNLRIAGYQGSILVNSSVINDQNYRHSCRELKINNTNKSADVDLAGVIHKLTYNRVIPQQSHPRYKTDQQITVQQYLSGEDSTSRLLNLSSGGAYLEYDNENFLANGDLLKLNISLDDIHKKHTLNGKVVWLKTSKNDEKVHGAGIEFINDNQIFDFLNKSIS